MITDRALLRQAALTDAITIAEITETPDCEHGEHVERILHTAEQIYTWITEPGPAVSLNLTVGTVVDQP